MVTKRAFAIVLAAILCTTGCGPYGSHVFPGGESALYRVENIKILREIVTKKNRFNLAPEKTSWYTLRLYCKLVTLENQEYSQGPYVLCIGFDSEGVKAFLREIQGKFIKVPFSDGLSWGGTDAPGDGKSYQIIYSSRPDLLRPVEMTTIRSAEGESKEGLLLKGPMHFKTLEELTKFVDDAQIYSSKGEGR